MFQTINQSKIIGNHFLGVLPQAQWCLAWGGEVQRSSSYWTIPTRVSLWGRMRSSVSCCVKTAGANSTSTHLDFASGSATMATCTGGPWRGRGRGASPPPRPSLSSVHDRRRRPFETLSQPPQLPLLRSTPASHTIRFELWTISVKWRRTRPLGSFWKHLHPKIYGTISIKLTHFHNHNVWCHYDR